MNLRPFNSQAKLDAEAADWLARRDRGLTPREQDAYLQWLREDERRPAAIARAEATLRRVLQLSAWRHEHSTEPNPDLLARPRRAHPWRWVALAAAAAVVVGFGVWWHTPPARVTTVVAKKNYLRTNEQIALPDGSRAELREGSTLDVRFTAGERRVRLTGGEAQFSVMKDAARPFVVEAGGVAVRARRHGRRGARDRGPGARRPRGDGAGRDFSNPRTRQRALLRGGRRARRGG